MEMLHELLLRGVPKVLLLQGAIGIIICLMFHQLVLSDSHEYKQFWKKQVWVGLRAEWFPKFRASLRTISGIRQMLDEGYEKVGSWASPYTSGDKPVLVNLFH
jgi:hypothetical protein